MQWRSSYVQWIQRTFIHATYWEVVALLIGNGSARSVHSVSRCWEAPAGGHGDLSPSSVQKQHGEHPARKMWLRRAVLAEVGDGAAYVPFIGSGDIPLACYPERTIYGIDLDPARVADARAALAFASVIVGDCDEGGR